MKNILLRILLLIVITISAHNVRAEWVQQWNEDFTGLSTSITSGLVNSFKDWTLSICYVTNNTSSDDKCLKLGIYRNNYFEVGTATTPSIGVTGWARLTFTYARGTADAYNAELHISVSGGGTVVDNTVFKPSSKEHVNGELLLKNLTSNSKIIFTSSVQSVAIDNIVVSTPSTITLDQNEDNSTVLTENSGGVVNVATVRTLREGIWNTLCLPFAVNKEVIDDALGEGCKVSTYTSYANNVMTFSPSTVNSNTSISAGTPFLIKVNATVTNPTFKAVTITTTTPRVVTDNGVSFVGCYSSTKMATDGTELFIGTDNYMYKPEEGKNIIGGLRAFIRRSNIAGSRMSVNIDEESLAVTAPAKMERTEPTAYTLQGVRTNAAKKGVYIVDGKKRVIR